MLPEYEALFSARNMQGYKGSGICVIVY